MREREGKGLGQQGPRIETHSLLRSQGLIRLVALFLYSGTELGTLLIVFPWVPTPSRKGASEYPIL